MSEIKETIQRLVAGMIKPAILIGQVKAFSEGDWTITVALNRGGTVEDVRITATIPAGESGIFVEPAIDSYVLCGMIEGKIESLCVLLYTDIVRYRIIATSVIEWQGDSFGGIVKSEKVHSTDKQIIDEINELKQILTAWAPVPNDGGAALKTALASWATPLPVPAKTDYENEKVKHG